MEIWINKEFTLDTYPSLSLPFDSWEAKDFSQSKVKRLEDLVPRNPFDEALWDIHRQIQRDMNERKLWQLHQFAKLARHYISTYGTFFNSSVDDLHAHSLLDYKVQFAAMAEVLNQYDRGNRPLLDLESQISIHTSTKFEEKRTNLTHSLRANSLLGWCYLNIAREVVDGVTYSRCPYYESCGRFIPSISPRGKKVTHCSGPCRQRFNRYVQAQADALKKRIERAKE